MKIKQSALFSDKRIFIFFYGCAAFQTFFITRYQTKRKTNTTHWIKLNFLTPTTFRPKMPFSDGPNPAAWRVTAFKHTVCQKKYVFSKFFWQIKIAKKLHFIDNHPRSVGSVHPPFPISGEPPFALPHSTMILFLCILSVLSPSPWGLLFCPADWFSDGLRAAALNRFIQNLQITRLPIAWKRRKNSSIQNFPP